MSERDFESGMYVSFEARVREARPKFVALIEEVTKWEGVDDLAGWMIELLVTNVGSSSVVGIRPPCWQEHAPLTVAQFTDMLTKATKRPADDPVIQQQVAEYRERLRERFGL